MVHIDEHEKEKTSILRQPLGEVMRREISTDFLKKDIALPRFLKKEIPIGFLDKEIRLTRKKEPEAETPESTAIDLIECYSCGKQTPSTVASCLSCGAHLDAPYKKLENGEARRQKEVSPTFESNRTLIDLADDIL